MMEQIFERMQMLNKDNEAWTAEVEQELKVLLDVRENVDYATYLEDMLKIPAFLSSHKAIVFAALKPLTLLAFGAEKGLRKSTFERSSSSKDFTQAYFKRRQSLVHKFSQHKVFTAMRTHELSWA